MLQCSYFDVVLCSLHFFVMMYFLKSLVLHIDGELARQQEQCVARRGSGTRTGTTAVAARS